MTLSLAVVIHSYGERETIARFLEHGDAYDFWKQKLEAPLFKSLSAQAKITVERHGKVLWSN